MSGDVPPDVALSIGAPDPQGLGEGLSGDSQVPAAGEEAALSEQELGSVDSQELRGTARKGNYEAMVPLGSEDAGSKPALLPPAEDREDPGSPGLPEKGAVPGQLGDSEMIVIKTEEQQPQEDGAELLALPMVPAVRLDEEVPLSQEQPVSWESHGVAGPKAAGEGLGEFCLGEFKPVVVPVEAHPAPGLPFPTEHALGAGTEQPFALAQGMPPGEDPVAECAESFPQKASLEEHQRRHTQQRPFQCHGCTKSFRHRQSLNHHQKVHAVATSPAGSLPGHEPELEPCEALSQDNR
ncbi:hypothetical protein DV515_00016670 [Chloebia gouldiae]|uniref:C2H2-type domain-containing protein n=1 Tax=Chloebia gouldiae TaxID=44316 RepID=A0A3L8RRE1_CHLGU|nr:hypothetical protein DV515_00016670 [Chloebia gouldiae]